MKDVNWNLIYRLKKSLFTKAMSDAYSLKESRLRFMRNDKGILLQLANPFLINNIHQKSKLYA